MKNIIDISLGAVFFVMVAFTYLQNYKYNDNSMDWLNNDYSLGLIRSVTTNTVLMTEGGDNQVFGLAYFQMVEFKRPDVVCYDQKGNVFKRIYGDLRYLPFQNLQLRMDVVDYNIINGFEPFYKGELRTKGEPTFEEYKFKDQVGKKNVYMTWTGKELWKYGDYYYKQYGMMYKVSDSKYFIVDKLKEYKSLPIDYVSSIYKSLLIPNIDAQKVFELTRVLEYEGYVKIETNRVIPKKEFVYTGGKNGKLLFNEIVKRVVYEESLKGLVVDQVSYNNLIPIIRARAESIYKVVFNQVLGILSKEGYITVKGDRIYFLKDYEHPNGLDTMDYYNYYKQRWTQTPVSVWWDYLTKEIASSFNYSLAKYYFDKMSEYKNVTNIVEPTVRSNLLNLIAEYKEMIPKYLDEAVKYGSDMAPMLFNSAMLYYQMSKYYLEDKDIEKSKQYFLKALDLLREAIRVDMFASYAFIRFGVLALEYANSFASPEEEGRYLDEVKVYCDTLIKNLSYRRQYGGDPKKAPEYNDLNLLKNISDRFKSTPKSNIVQYEMLVQTTTDDAQKAQLYLQLANMYLARFSGIDVQMLNKSKSAMENYIKFSKNKDLMFYMGVINYYISIRDFKSSYEYGLEGLRKVKDNAKYLYFAVAFSADNLGKRDEALRYYSEFVDSWTGPNTQEYNYAIQRISALKK
ncbi:MAG: hypothetical protein RMJ37_02340 [Spirochaetia bacterium]|nr:hypothetical protein [Spirochaetota bacterium]MDW8112165.1 hypothetical protein [Spirochaetia bacterium]